MKPRLAALTLGLTALVSVSHAQPARTVVAPASALVVVARLTEDLPANLAHCGILHIAMPFRYEVLRVESGRYAPHVLYAIHSCPSMSRRSYHGAAGGGVEALHRGDVHRLTLSTRVPSGPSVIDDHREPGVPRYWVVRADQVWSVLSGR